MKTTERASLILVCIIVAVVLFCAAKPLFIVCSYAAAMDPNDPYDPNDPNDPSDPNDPYDPNEPYDPNNPYDPNDPNFIMSPDINADGIVNYMDFHALADYWLRNDCNSINWCYCSDLDRNGIVDMNDVLIMAESWLGVSSPSTHFYVSKQGSDQNDGTCPTNQGPGTGPFATIQKGLQVLATRDAAGDVLSIRGGTYYEECTGFGGINAGSTVVIQNYNGEQVFLDGGKSVTGWTQCALYEQDLAVNGSMPPNWSSYYMNVYKADITADTVYFLPDFPYYGVKLSYDDELCFPCGVVDMPYAVFPDLENQGWNMTASTSTTIKDTVHLTQPQDYWNDSFIWFIGDTDNVAYCRRIDDSNSVTATLTFDICPAGVDKNKKYWIYNHPHYLNDPGEYYWDPNGLNGSYTIFYYKKPGETIADLNAHMKVLSKSAGIRFSVSSSNLLITGLNFRNYQTRGDVDSSGHLINGGPTGQCGFICCTNWCNSLSNITIRDCTFRNFFGNEGGAIAFGECEMNIVVDTCTISDIGRGAGIRLYGEATDKIQGVTVKDCTLSRIWGSNIRPYFASDVRITGNVVTQFDGVHGNAVTVYGSCDNVLVGHNFISGGTNALVMKDTDGMYIFSNVFRCTDESGSVSIWDVDYRAVAGNLFILQNTILTSSPTVTRALFFLDQNNAYLPSSAAVVVKNNIIDGFEYASDWNSVVMHDYNLYLEQSPHQAGACSNCSPWTYGSHETTNLNGHLFEFIDYPNEDYRIRSGSTAAGTGMSIVSELQTIENLFPSYDCGVDLQGNVWGSPPSIGAYERIAP